MCMRVYLNVHTNTHMCLKNKKKVLTLKSEFLSFLSLFSQLSLHVIHTHTHTHTHTHQGIHNTQPHNHTHARTHTCVCVFICIYTYTYNACAHVQLLNLLFICTQTRSDKILIFNKLFFFF